MSTPLGGFREEAPYAYQELDGRRTTVAAAYALEADGSDGGAVAGFRVGAYDPRQTLVIDPALIYSGYIGGPGLDVAFGIAVDGSGNAYIAGATTSSEATFPVAVGPDLTHNGAFDAFVAKVNPAGTGLVYAGYIGGSESDGAADIAVDGSGNAYITGTTASSEATFPVTVGPDLTFNGNVDAFVAKINSAGTGLVYAGYISLGNEDQGQGIAVDGSGSAYVGGFSSNPDRDGFVVKVDPAGTGLTYSLSIAGAFQDEVLAVAVDGSGNAYVTGRTNSPDFP